MSLKFKNYLRNAPIYKGGKSKAEVMAKGKKLYKLSSNENQLGTSPKVLAAIQKYITSISEYPDLTDDRLKKALADFYKNQLSANQFITTNSGVASLELVIRGFLEEGTECIYANPAFPPYYGFSQKVGAKCIDVPLLGDDFQLDVTGILHAITEKTRLIFITSPNNPTGSYIPKNQMDHLVENLPDHVVLVFDEVYFQFADASDFIRPLPYVLAGKNVIGINSFSKAYGLAGLRIGYAYTTPEIATYIQKLRRPFMINSLSLEAAIAALEDPDFIAQTVNLVQTEKKFLYKKLDELGVKYWETQANFFLMKPQIAPAEFEEAMLQEGVMVRQAAGFGAPECIRVTIGTREGNEAFINGLKKIKRR